MFNFIGSNNCSTLISNLCGNYSFHYIHFLFKFGLDHFNIRVHNKDKYMEASITRVCYNFFTWFRIDLSQKLYYLMRVLILVGDRWICVQTDSVKLVWFFHYNFTEGAKVFRIYGFDKLIDMKFRQISFQAWFQQFGCLQRKCHTLSRWNFFNLSLISIRFDDTNQNFQLLKPMIRNSFLKIYSRSNTSLTNLLT